MSESTVTPEDLAEALGYKRAFDVKRWVQGRTLPPLRMLEPISRALKCCAGDLLVVWAMTQEPKLAEALGEEVVRQMDPAKRRVARNCGLRRRPQATQVSL